MYILLVLVVNYKKYMEKENKLLWLAYEELLELRGFLTQTGMFNPDYEKLKKYWNSGKPQWEKELNLIK